MILRPDYIKAVSPFIDVPLVKILAGVRRAGKSTIFEMIKQELISRGVSKEQIISRKYTEMDIEDGFDAEAMYRELKEKMSGRQDIWYATNGEIFRYVRAYDRLQFAAEAKFVYNPSACDVYLDVFGRRRVARAGEVSDLR